VAVYRTNGGSSANGKWIGITATEGVNFTYNIGFNSTKSVELKTSEEYKLSQEMNAGFSFLGVGVKSTVAESYTQTIVEDTLTSMTKDVSIEWPISCTGAVGPSGGVGLW